jgi:hypothetical protein
LGLPGPAQPFRFGGVGPHDDVALVLGSGDRLAYVVPADPRQHRALGADLVFLAGYLLLKDIPPFVFYLLFLVVGAVVW